MTVKTFMPEVRLRKLMRKPGGISVSQALERAEAGVETLRERCIEGLDEKIASIVELAVSDAPDRAQSIYQLSNEIFSEAGTFGLVELSQAAHSLCSLLCNDDGARAEAAIAVHIDALRALRHPDVRAEASRRKAVLDGLRAVVARFAAEKKAAG